MFFFIMGINQGQKSLDFRQNTVCPCCSRYSAIEVFVTYTVLTLFFIPTFRWNRRYFVKTACCGMVCELDKETGRKIEKGERAEIDVSSLRFEKSHGGGAKTCRNCGYRTDDDFAYCPRCGVRF